MSDVILVPLFKIGSILLLVVIVYSIWKSYLSKKDFSQKIAFDI